MITKLFPTQCSVYAKGPVGENVLHVAMLLNTPSTLAITRYLVKLYGTVLVNCPVQVQLQDLPWHSMKPDQVLQGSSAQQ